MTAIDLVLNVADALEAAGVPYMLVGSFATNLYGTPRATKDADFVILLGSTAIREVVSRLGSAFALEPQMTFETITSTIRYRLTHVESAFLVELFELSNDTHDQARFARRCPVQFGQGRLWVPTAEDTVITKLRWSRHSGREKDIEDARSVVAVQHAQLDVAYIRHWCDEHGTRNAFERIWLEVAQR